MASRQTDWMDTVVGDAAATGTQASRSLITGLAPSNMRGTTAIRTLVSLDFASSTVAGAWGLQRVDFAIGMTSQEAFAAGTLPDPAISSDRPSRGWIYRTSLLVSQNGSGAPIVFPVRADIRGARKIENGEMFLVFDNTAIDGTTFTVHA